MIYYVGTEPYSSDLYHHGIKGQKWGIRRYQNQDGSLTAEGLARYGSVENFQAEQARKKERREAFKAQIKSGYASTRTKLKEANQRSYERGQRLSEAGYKRRYNVGNAAVSLMGTALATSLVSSALKSSQHETGAKIVQALGFVSAASIVGKTAQNMHDYGNYRRTQRLSRGVR